MDSTDDLRAAVAAAVAARVPVDERERRSVETIGALLGELDDPFDERRGPVHVTGSAIVVGRAGVLLLVHKRLGIWVQPGGHLDPGETPWDAARREATEETGLEVHHALGEPVLVHVDVHPGGRGHTHLDLRYLFLAGGEPAPPPGESQEVRWLTWPDAIRLADAGLSGALVALAPDGPGQLWRHRAQPLT